MKKVCLITTGHPTFDTRIYFREAQSLKKVYDVTLIAPAEGNLEKDGVKIISLGKPTGRLSRIRKNFSAFNIILRSDSDFFHFHEPEFIPFAVILKTLKGKKWVYDVHENFPEYILDKEWIPLIFRSTVSFITEKIENFGARVLDGIIVVNENLEERFKKYNKNVALIVNFPKKDFAKEFKALNFEKRKKIALFVGGIEKERGFFEMLEVAKKFKNSGLKILLVGPTKESRIGNEVNKKNILELKKEVPYAEVGKIMNQSLIGLIPFLKTRNNYLGTPLKMFEYMAYGLPIIASDFPFIHKYITKANCGILIKDPRNIKEFEEVLRKISTEKALWEVYSHNARKAFEEEFNWEKQENKFLDFYKRFF